MTDYTIPPDPQKVEAEGSGSKVISGYRRFEANRGYMRPCPKQETKNENQRVIWGTKLSYPLGLAAYLSES